MIIPAQHLRVIKPVNPFVERTEFPGTKLTYGLGPAGYDIRSGTDLRLYRGSFELGVTLEQFEIPDDVLGVVHDKSTWARKGISVFNTIIDPGWEGFLTLEIVNRGFKNIIIEKGMPIAQVIFHRLERPTNIPYNGKYQNQGPEPQEAII